MGFNPQHPPNRGDQASNGGAPLEGDGWLKEDANGFSERGTGIGWLCSGLPLTLWSRHFASGSSYSIDTKDLMIGGVISECSDV